MPELPDLEVFSKNLKKKLAGKKLQSIDVSVAKKLNVPVKQLKDTLEGQSIKNIYRDGKELFIAFSGGDVLGLHLMLHGKLYLYKEKIEEKFAIIALQFDDDTGFVLTDFQKAATPTLNPEPKAAPDALSKDVDVKFLEAHLAKTRTTIKNFLLDQKVMRGIGNAYADEILWHARIAPASVCKQLPSEKIAGLLKSIRTVLADAQEQIIKIDPDIINGELRDFMAVHHSKKKTSPTGGKIETDTIGGRKTYFTDEQELYT